MNTATRFLAAAAHLDSERTYADIDKRYLRKTIKVAPPEIGVDVPTILQEARKGHARHVRKNLLVLLILIFVVATPEAFPANAFTGFVIAWILELSLELAKRRYVLKQFFPVRQDIGERSLYFSDKNVIVFGGFSPFVGAGKNVSGWSFVVDLTKPDENHQKTDPISAQELYAEIEKAMAQLGVKHLFYADQLFVYGADVGCSGIEKDDAGLPKCSVSREVVDSYESNDDSTVRHYKVFRVPICDGELVLSTYVRFATAGRYLYVESTSFLLPPLYDELKTLQKLRQTLSLMQTLRMVGIAVFRALVSWLVALFWLVSRLGVVINNISYSAEQREASTNPTYNFGWSESLREKWSKDFFDRFFQILDNDMFLKLLEKGLLDAIIDSLDARGISTESLKERQSTIINEGVMVTGGHIQADALTVGKGATSTYKRQFGFKKRGTYAKEGA